jgi:hypothetical protein
MARHEFEAEGEAPQTTTKLEAGSCAADTKGQGSKLGLRVSSTEVRWLPRRAWSFSAAGKPDPCSVTLSGSMEPEQIYVLLYRPEPPVVAGLGLAGLRDIAAALKSGENLGPIHRVSRVLGYGYSQSARLLRQFVEDGFNSDGSGKRAFDGLFVAAAGAGGASVNHRFAQPGVAGNSVTSFHRAVDLIDREPPKLGREYVTLVPTVDADGNEVSGIRMPSVAAPLAAWTGWNLDLPSRANIRVLGGLAGSVVPFSTPEIASRYSDRNAYLGKVRAITTELVSRGFVLAEDAAHIDVRANVEWEQFSKPE